MILECTECRTRYLLPDSAIGEKGRTVRCASCRHSWFQPGVPLLDLVARAEAPPPEAPPPPPPPPPPRPAPISASPPSEPPADAEEVTGDGYPEYDAFAHEPPFRPRRNPARRWTLAALAAGLAMSVAAVGILYSDAPSFARDLFRPSEETPLRIVKKPAELHRINGNEILAVSGIVINPTDRRQPVPDIRADLRDAQKRIVFSWIIRPDARSLPPKGRIQFDSAQVNVPVNAQEVAYSFSGATAR